MGGQVSARERGRYGGRSKVVVDDMGQLRPQSAGQRRALAARIHHRGAVVPIGAGGTVVGGGVAEIACRHRCSGT